VSLVVSDNGCGMDVETRARLFEPFFTTKKPGQGTGLGLATVERIVGAAGGTIEVESEPGHGTSIAVFFPAIAPDAGAMEAVRSL
jgi:signal transduction histidine kinase